MYTMHSIYITRNKVSKLLVDCPAIGCKRSKLFSIHLCPKKPSREDRLLYEGKNFDKKFHSPSLGKTRNAREHGTP